MFIQDIIYNRKIKIFFGKAENPDKLKKVDILENNVYGTTDLIHVNDLWSKIIIFSKK